MQPQKRVIKLECKSTFFLPTKNTPGEVDIKAGPLKKSQQELTRDGNQDDSVECNHDMQSWSPPPVHTASHSMHKERNKANVELRAELLSRLLSLSHEGQARAQQDTIAKADQQVQLLCHLLLVFQETRGLPV